MSSSAKDPNKPISNEEGSSDGMEAYAGRWVATRGDRIVGQGGTPEQAANSAKASWFKEEPQVSYIPMAKPFTISDLLEKIYSVLPNDRQIYLVGGALRDRILGYDAKDIDFVLKEGALEVGRRVADALGGAYYALDEERQTARVIIEAGEGERNVLDFAIMRGGNLESDLANRDFTINAMAVETRNPEELLDPLGGLADLHAKRLKSCSPTTFQDDPLRILRGVRLAAGFNFRIFPETLREMRQSVVRLGDVSAERLRDELFRILQGPQPATAMRALELLGVFPYLLPELIPLKGLSQFPPHIYDVWDHTLETVRQLEFLLQVLSPEYDPDKAANLKMGLLSLRIGRYRGEINKQLQTRFTPERSLRPLLFLATLYHDTGKAISKQADEENEIHFYGHEVSGSKLAKGRARKLCLSSDEVERIEKIVASHMRPLHLVNSKESPSRRAIYRFYRDLNDVGVDVCLLSLADTLATYGATLPQELWSRHLELVRTMFEAWWEQPTERVRPPVLVTGNDLITELRLESGPIIGRLLDSIREAQAAGDVTTYDEALQIARDILANT